MILFRMKTAISKIVVIVFALGIVVSTIGSSAAVRAEATHFQGGTYTGPDKTKLVG
jgi:hypothetical protein